VRSHVSCHINWKNFPVKCGGFKSVNLYLVQEMLLASSAPADADTASEDGAEGSFVGSRFQLDYLTKPNGFSDMLINWGQPDVVDRAQDTDEVTDIILACLVVG